MKITFDEDSLLVTYAGETIALLPKEFALFQYLFLHEKQIFSREHLLDAVWPLENPTDRTVDDHIYRIRKKLKVWEHLISIETVRGRGYRLTFRQEHRLSNPLSSDADLIESYRSLLNKYQLFGQGEAMQSLAEHQYILGVNLNEEKSVFLRAVKGDFLWIVRHPFLPFHEKLFYLVAIYWYVQFDSAKTLALMEAALHKKVMPEVWQKDMEFSKISLYIEAGCMKRAEQALQKAENKIIKENLKGLLLFLEIKKALFHFASGHEKATEDAIHKVDSLLVDFPYLREKGIFFIIKGLWFLACGKSKKAEIAIDEGIYVLKQSRFVPHLLYGLHLLHTFLYKHFESETTLCNKYNRMWRRIAHQYHFKELEKETYDQLIAFL